ncbi:ABC transporter substrate-binding protein [Bradyrhizobium guangzhouense]|uniref:ABC transporter substrate-binding protein n=1 Tax=Bradyrhizobium guangzhouense TaxID=1325095 RepID=A0ABY0E6X5_9BRAD|nr:substrate-binding domain-containing protein [Bradyrhizobium guangzhouense]RXH11781.1 ABC transporter substrate-binding protein [Bradyrhizobium guangzhouense]
MNNPHETEIIVLSAVAIHAELEELLPRFSREHGLEIQANYDVNPAVAKRVMAGEVFDVGLNNPWYVEEMIAQGRVVPDVHVPFGRIPLAIGAVGPERDIVSSHAAIRDLLANADTIAYTDIGTSGKTFLRAVKAMGLEKQLSDRLRPMGAGEPPLAVSQGRVQYAIAPLSRIVTAHGIVPVAKFPDELDLSIDMSMFIHIQSKRRDASAQLIRFLSDAAHDAYLLSHGIARYKP